MKKEGEGDSAIDCVIAPKERVMPCGFVCVCVYGYGYTVWFCLVSMEQPSGYICMDGWMDGSDGWMDGSDGWR